MSPVRQVEKGFMANKGEKKKQLNKADKALLVKKYGTVFVFVLGLVLVIVAGWNLYRIFKDYHDSNELYDTMEEEYAEENSEAEVPWYEMFTVDLEGLQEDYPDVVGWIYFENEEISYPVLYSGDDSTYLRTAMDGSAATAGSIFMEGANTPDFEDYHTIIYGHNMRNLSMFGKLKYYKEDGYYDDHMYFQIIKEDVIYRYQIFAYEDMAADGFVWQVFYGSDDTFQEFINEIYKLSYIDTGVTATKDDRIITLSTCSTTDNRFLVHAVRVDSHERTAETE